MIRHIIVVFTILAWTILSPAFLHADDTPFESDRCRIKEIYAYDPDATMDDGDDSQ